MKHVFEYETDCGFFLERILKLIRFTQNFHFVNKIILDVKWQELKTCIRSEADII